MKEAEEVFEEEDEPTYAKLRIRWRGTCWAVEGYQEGGGIISRGPYAGQPKKAKWIDQKPLGWYSHLKHAASRMIDHELARTWPKDGDLSSEELRAMVVAAEDRVYKAAQEAIEGLSAKAAKVAK